MTPAVMLGVEVQVEALVTLMAPYRVTETRGGGRVGAAMQI